MSWWNHRVLAVMCVLAGFEAGVPKLLAQTLPFDHVHLATPDAGKAAEWYMKYLGATKAEGATPRVAFGPVLVLFQQLADAPPSAGSVVDHIGLSFANLDAKMAEFQAAGIKIVSPVRDAPGLFKLAFIEDPWGVKIEVVQDAETLGFHHVHLRATDPESMYKWLSASFGGERTKLKGRLDALKYGNVWVLVQKADQEPAASAGHAIEHIGWRPLNLDATAAELKGKGVKFSGEPRALGALRIAFVEGPSGLRIELVQR